MSFCRRKFQQIISILLLSGYLIANFSLPIFEGVHFLFHLGDEVPMHSFYTHSAHHQHQLLTALDELVADSSTDVPTKNSSSIDSTKIVQQLVVAPIISFTIPIISNSSITTQVKIHKSPFLQINAPPPKV